jgi:multidrug efflux pump subunit AcrB
LPLDGKPAIGIGIYQLPGANALDVDKQVRVTMEQLKKNFPSGVDYKIVYDTTEFVTASIVEVVKTLFEAFILVFIVVFVFLQNFRATLIPAITIPVSLIGTFALINAFGFSINTLSLFGLVLAIGLVVDDAIVVVENVSRLLQEKDISPKEATSAAMKEVTGPSCDLARAHGRLRSRVLHAGNLRADVQAVRPDDRLLGRYLGNQRPHTEPCPLRALSP